MAGIFDAATNTWKPSPDADWKLTNLHREAPDCAEGCLIHNPTSWVGEDWPYFQRMDGRWERICPHGIGHPDPDVGRFLVQRIGWSVAAAYTHGCCGCCAG